VESRQQRKNKGWTPMDYLPLSIQTLFLCDNGDVVVEHAYRRDVEESLRTT
jgi:hypothetical protein